MPGQPKHRPLLNQPDQAPRPDNAGPPKPVANDDPRHEVEPPLGSWRAGNFEFTSPAARETWHRSAYTQGVNPQNWHQGTEIDDRTHDIIKAGLGGPTPPLYRGPDGKYRFGNMKTMEPPELRNIRARHFQGKSIDDLEATIATTGKVPGEDEAVTHLLAPPHRPQPAALSTNAAAILGGMERARRTKPDIVATVAQADTGLTMEPRSSLPKPDDRSISQQALGPIHGPLPPKKPLAPIDAPRRAEIIVFQPVGKRQSSFGHVAIEIDGLLYSWTPSGLFLTTKDEYLKTNDFRDGTGYPLRLTGDEVKRLENYILQYDTTAKYNPVTANCTDPIEQGLESLGYNVGLTVLPAQLQKALIASELASREKAHFYPANPARKSPAATMPWSILSMPE